MRPQIYQLEKSPNALRKLPGSRLALAFTRGFPAKRKSVWIALIFLLAQVYGSKANLKHDASSCSQIGHEETNVTLMNGLDNPKVHRFILGHVKTLEECVQIACKRENLTLAYISRFDCFGISCDGEEETCWLLPSFQNPTLVFARLHRGIPKVHNTTINNAGKLSKVQPKKNPKKARSVGENLRDSSWNENVSSILQLKRRSKDEELISTLSSSSRPRRNVLSLEYDEHKRLQRSVSERPFLELPYLWKRRRKPNQRIRKNALKDEDIVQNIFAKITKYDIENSQNTRNSYNEDNANRPLERRKRDIEDDSPGEQEDETIASYINAQSRHDSFSGSGDEEINQNVHGNQGDMGVGQSSLFGSGSNVKANSQEALHRYKRNFDEEEEEKSSDDSLSFLGKNKMKDEENDNEVRRYKRKLDDDDDDDTSSTNVWSSGEGTSDPTSDTFSGDKDQTEDNNKGNSLGRYKRKAVEPEEMDELSKALSSASPSKRSLEENGSEAFATTKSISNKKDPSSTATSTATSWLPPVESGRKSKSKKKDSLTEKKDAVASPQETTSSSSSSTSISVSSRPPPPPSSTSSSSSISVTTSSTGSLPNSQTSTTKVSSSSTTVPKSFNSKVNDDTEKLVQPVAALPAKGLEKVHKDVGNKDMKKLSAAATPQESTSSSSSASVSIGPIPLPPQPPPPPSSTSSSSTSVSQTSSSSTSTQASVSFPKGKSSKKKDAPKRHVEINGKKSSAVPPQESTSSSSSASVSIGPIPLPPQPPPPPPPPSSTSSSSTSVSQTSSSSTSTQVSVSFPKGKSSKKKDAPKKHVEMNGKKSSAVPPQESTSSSASVSIGPIPLPPQPPPPPSSTSSSSTSSSSVSQTSSSSTSAQASVSFPKGKSSKTKDRPKKHVEMNDKKSSAVPPQQSTSSSSSASVSIGPIPPPPPPPPSSTSSSSTSVSQTSSSSTSTQASVSFPKGKSSKTKDAPKKKVEMNGKKSSAVPPQESTSSSASVSIGPIPLPPQPPPIPPSSTSSSSTSVTQTSSSSTSTQVSVSFPKGKSSKTTKDASKKHVEMNGKKSSAVPPQESTSSSASVSIGPIPLPPQPPPPPSTSSSSSTSVSQSSTSSTSAQTSVSFPKGKSFKTTDALKEHMEADSLKSSLKTKLSTAKSRSIPPSVSAKKENRIHDHEKPKMNRNKKTSSKEKRNDKENKKKVPENGDKNEHKQKRQAAYGLWDRIGISNRKQATRSNVPVRTLLGSTVGYGPQPKLGQRTLYRPLQQRGLFNMPINQYMPRNGYKLLTRSNKMSSSFHQPVVNRFGAQSPRLFPASTTGLPFSSIFPRPSVNLGFTDQRSFIPSASYARPNNAGPEYQQVPFRGGTYGSTYNAQSTMRGRFQEQDGRVLTAQMKSRIPHYETLRYSSTMPYQDNILGGQRLEGDSCGFALGMQDGTIKNDQLTSSSNYSMYHSAAQGRLGNTPKPNGFAGAWCTGTKHVDSSQYLQIDLGQRRRVCRVATQGMPEFSTWVKEYTLEFSNNGHIWADYTEEGHEKVFQGNTDRNTPASHSLKQPITARFIRFKPQSWHGPNICMRAELYSSTDPGLKPRDRISRQGLVVYLNFDKSEGKLTNSRRTEISRAPGVCGEVASLRNGNNILLDGRKIQPKPRDAITIAAWIRLDNTSGQHSIFDTVGGHSSHGSGQYHFEVSDGKLRWYHRNESANQIFSVESDAVVSENTWTHVAGTYDSHTGISKVYIDGHVNGQAQGSGLLSQDWDSHVGVGRHKDSRFLNGLMDEFRIYDYAMEEPEIKKLMMLCDYAKSCGGSLDASSGVIESPNWPNGYKDVKSCTWKIAVKKTDKIALNFEKFDLQEDGNCDKSRLVIRDGEDEKAKEIGQFCGLNSPRLMRSTANRMWLRFTSTPEGEGKGFRLTYHTEENRESKKAERPRGPAQSMKCSASTPEYNVTLKGGIKAGTFSEALGVKTLDMCMRQCCLKESCSLAFMISDSCYLVSCKDEESCKTKKARPSGMNPTIAYITHLKEEPHSGLPEEGTSPDNPRPIPPPSQCHHTDVSYNVTLVGGIKAGKFNTFGHMTSTDDCIRHCCHDDKCDVAFMIQNNCYNVECANARGCQMKKAKPSPYNPTLVYVYRGKSKPIAEPIKKITKPPRTSCRNFQLSDTLQNVTLIGGIKSGTFTDKGVVNDIEECKAFCCAEESCNVAFLIRKNCFLVACKDYESCKVKPAISDYYHPKLAYVNWYAPDEEVSPYDKYASLGCWRDTESFAIPSLEGTDPLLSESYRRRAKPIDTCAAVAFKHGYKVFGIHKGGACFSGPKADQTFNTFGESADCKKGRGGVGAIDVYRLDYTGKYSKLGCWRDSRHRALKTMEHANPILNDFYQTRNNPVEKCAEVAKQQGYPVFAMQDGGECLSGPNAEDEYNKYGVSRDCRGRLGSAYANSVYKLIGNFDLQNEQTNNTSMKGTENSTSKASMSKPEEGINQVIGDDLPSDTSTTSMREDFVTMKNGEPKRIVYTAGKIQYNVTLKYGYQAGEFMEKGRVSNISQCISNCGRQPDCDLAFMLGDKCFAVSCKSKEFCVTKPAFSAFYNPAIVFVTHRKIYDTVKSQQKRCHVSTIQNDVTLVGGINAGYFMDFGTISNMNACVKRCCAKPTCDVAFKLEGQCYGVSCTSNKDCETRRARNAARYKPQIAYVYHDSKGLDQEQTVTVTFPDEHATRPRVEQKHAKKKTDNADDSLINDKHRSSGTETSTQTAPRQDNNHNTTDSTLVNNTGPSSHNNNRTKSTTGRKQYQSHIKFKHLNDETLSNIHLGNEGKEIRVHDADYRSKAGTNSYRFGDVKTCGNVDVIQSGAQKQRNGSLGSLHKKNGAKIQQENQETFRQRLLANFVMAGERTNQNIDKIDQSHVDIKKVQLRPFIKQGLMRKDKLAGQSHFSFNGAGLTKISPINVNEEDENPTYVKSNGAKETNLSVLSQPATRPKPAARKNTISKHVTNTRKKQYKKGGKVKKMGLVAQPLDRFLFWNEKNKNMKMMQKQSHPISLTAFGPQSGNILNGIDSSSNSNNFRTQKQSHPISLTAFGPQSGNILNGIDSSSNSNNKFGTQKQSHPIRLVALGPKNGKSFNGIASLQRNENFWSKQGSKNVGLVALGPNSENVVIKHLDLKDFHTNQAFSPGRVVKINGHGLQKIKLVANNDLTLTTNQQTGPKQTATSLVNPMKTKLVDGNNDVTLTTNQKTGPKQTATSLANAQRYPKKGEKSISYYIHFLNVLLASNSSTFHGDSSSNGTVCWDGDVLYNQTLIGGINAGVFTDNGKTTTMDLCMQSCCKQPSCDLAFMIEDDCYSVDCTSPSSCKTRAARPTQFYPRISFTSRFKGLMSKETTGLASGTSAPPGPSTHSPTHVVAPSTRMTTTVAPRVSPTLKVHHSCSATPIKYNVTLRMGLHSGLFTKMGRVDSMDDCIELNCKQPKADVAFMMGTHCYAVQCYSEELCKTEPVFATSFSFLNLEPAVSFLRKNPGSKGHELALRENPRETCLESTITYDVTLRGGIHAGKFTERPHAKTMRGCISECCDADACDLAFMFGDRCYSVTCKSEKSCQAVLAKPTKLKPRISYMSRTSPNNDGVSLAESDDGHPICHADDISKSLIARNKTLAGGLEAGTFRFLGKVKSMGFCMHMCCARPRCDVAYLIDKNCFSITCFSPELCKITSNHAPVNGEVEISAMLKSVKKEKLPDETHSVVVYIIVGTLMFAAGLGGIVWAVCMFLRRHRLRERHRTRVPSDG